MDDMKKYIMKGISFLLVLSVLSPCVFAVDTSNNKVNLTVRIIDDGSSSSESISIDSSSPDGSVSHYFEGIGSLSYQAGSCLMSSPGTTIFTLSPVSSNFSVTGNADGFNVSYSLSDNTATVSVVKTSSATTPLCTLSFSGDGFSFRRYTQGTLSASGYSYTSSGSSGGGDEPENPYAGTGSMFGWTGKTIFGLQTRQMEKWFTDGSGYDRVGHLDATYDYGDAIGVPGYFVRNSMIASLTVQKWQWKISEKTGLPSFNVDENFQGTWSDMIYRTSVYNYFWANKLWSNDVSGSWYGSISDSFSYLNYRVNQIFDVLANDEDLQIKNATDEERNWVKDYFEGSGDKADSSKYDDLNNTGSAFKDVFEGAPDTSIADGFTAVNDNGYDFWSRSVSDDINGGASVSTYSDDPSQRIVDAYSENWAQIVGGYYD
jgi:hypothetical protein